MSGPGGGPRPTARAHDGRLQAAIARHQAGDLRLAERLYREILTHAPRHAEAHHRLGLVYSQQAKYAEAVRCFKQAVALDGGDPTFPCNLGEALRRLGQLDQAAAAFQRSADLAPHFAEAHYGLANTLKAQDRLDEAIPVYKRVLEINPGHSGAFYNLGNTYLAQGLFRSAITCYQAAVALHPDYAEAHNNLGVAFKELDRLDEAVPALRRATALQPEGGDAWRNLGQAIEKQGRLEAARACYRQAMAIEPDDELFALYVETLCPIIPESAAAVEAYWRHLGATLTRYLERDELPALDRLHRLDGAPPSTTVYHGRDEVAVKRRWAALFDGRIPISTADRRRRPGPGARPHIGFVVTHGHEGVFLKCMRGILNHMPGERFRLTIVCSRQAGPQILAPAITNPAVQYLALSNHLPHAVDQVRAAGFDLLHYWEVGTDGMNYFLPFYGLAPVQCATWGWPVTSGIPLMDYFLSCDLLETDESDDFYTEELVRLHHPPTYYYRPIAPAPRRSRAQLGFGENDHLYLCVQNLRKVQPDFDAVIGAVLRDDPKGRVLFIEDAQPGVTDLLRRRFQRTISDIADRVRFLARMPEADYLNLTAAADVVLDTFHYGGGANTTYDALAVGTPIVTMPGRFHRGRWAYAAYQRMGVTDGIANSPEDYVAIALRLASEPDHRREISDRITAACPVLFEDRGAVDEMAAFFEAAVRGVIDNSHRVIRPAPTLPPTPPMLRPGPPSARSG